MLKSRNQLTLFVNNCSLTIVLLILHMANRRLCAKYGIFDFIWGLHMDIPLTGIHASGPAIFMLYQW